MGAPLAAGPRGLLTRGQVRPVPPALLSVPNGLVGYWGFDPDCLDFRQRLAFDLSGNGNTGTLNALSATSLAQGQVGTALTFNGSSSYVSMGSAPLLEPPLPLTLSAWVNLVNLTNNVTIVTTDASAVNYYGAKIKITATTGTVECDFGNGGAPGGNSRQSKVSTAAITAGTWYFLCATMVSASNMQIYINGANAGGSYTGSGGTLAYSGTGSAIGKGVWGDAYAHGIIDDVRVYSRALYPWEVEELYRAGFAGRRDAGPRLPARASLPSLALPVLAGALAATEIPDLAAFAGGEIDAGALAASESLDLAAFAGGEGPALAVAADAAATRAVAQDRAFVLSFASDRP